MYGGGCLVLETVELYKVILTDQLMVAHRQKEYSGDGEVGDTRELWRIQGLWEEEVQLARIFFFMGVNLGMN